MQRYPRCFAGHPSRGYDTQHKSVLLILQLTRFVWKKNNLLLDSEDFNGYDGIPKGRCRLAFTTDGRQ